ncbi:hypothetical protein NDU88_000220 [Pleurodeles waltl]|uniref:Uncharacterized protein n=1 Tax=Pleurodeles waltl TaxID=8319 RepID=A0AAV7SVW8_PLEWA|nr:hypothetical protein NDU88_000220 [Pleurodeles waltl]
MFGSQQPAHRGEVLEARFPKRLHVSLKLPGCRRGNGSAVLVIGVNRGLCVCAEKCYVCHGPAHDAQKWREMILISPAVQISDGVSGDVTGANKKAKGVSLVASNPESVSE